MNDAVICYKNTLSYLEIHKPGAALLCDSDNLHDEQKKAFHL